MLINEERLKRYFWDTDFSVLDTEKDKGFIIERILELGDETAVEWMKKEFKKQELFEVLRKARSISKKSRRFWDLVLKS